jgi:hypothetical protein
MPLLLLLPAQTLAASALLELQLFRSFSHQQDSEPQSALAMKRAGAKPVWLEKQATQRLEESRQSHDIDSCIIEKLNERHDGGKLPWGESCT